ELQVYSFHAVGGTHYASVVGAMAEAEGVAQFVEGFFQQALREKLWVGRHAIEFLPEPVHRDDRAVVGELRLAEDKGQNGDIEVCLGYSQYPPAFARRVPDQSLEDFCGEILSPQGIIGEVRIQAFR